MGGKVNGRYNAAASNEARWSTTQDHWCTPGNVVAALQQFADYERIALDPCSNPNSIVGAKREWYGPEFGHHDGLILPWDSDGVVFFNPPFSAKMAWVQKAAREAGGRTEIIGLLPADTDTTWFQSVALTANALCFWRGRLTFRGDRDYPARFPCVLPYWGRRVARFRRVFSSRGWVVETVPYKRRRLGRGPRMGLRSGVVSIR